MQVHGLGNHDDRLDAYIALATLNEAYEVSVNVGQLGQLFLTEVSRSSQRTDVSAEDQKIFVTAHTQSVAQESRSDLHTIRSISVPRSAIVAAG